MAETKTPESRAQSRVKYYRRYRGYDYSRGVALFVTIVTEPRRSLFGRVVDAKIELNEFGLDVIDAIEAIPRFNQEIVLHGHVLMGDHLHMNLYLKPGLSNPLQTLGAAIRRFKTWTTTLARKRMGLASIWQQGYHDRICVSRRFIEATERYIAYNPLKFELMHNRPEFLRIREPLDSPRLSDEGYWKGIGNVALLSPDQKIVSLRISRKVKDLAPVVARMESAVRQGYAILSGFISPGEIAVRDRLLGNKDARLIHILPSCLANGHRPDSRYLPLLQEGRFLEIGEGNDETDFGRSACLALNDEIAAIARAGEGLALYWRAEGPAVLRGAEPAIQDLRGAEPAIQD